MPMVYCMMDEPESPFDPAAWRAWREKALGLPPMVLNRGELLEQADNWLKWLDASTDQ